MSLSFKRQLANIHNRAVRDKLELKDKSLQSPIEAVKNEVRKDLAISEVYCFRLLKGKSAFSGLADDQIRALAQNVEKCNFVKGDRIMDQGVLGDCCFILESGTAAVVRTLTDDAVLDLGTVEKESIMGEMCFFTDEPRPTTVIVSSDTAKLFKLKKSTYSLIIDSTRHIYQDIRGQLAKDVVAKVPIFSRLTSVNKQQVIDAMIPVQFPDRTYICREGKLGKGFYVITEGKCIVTMTVENGQRKQIRILESGDYFGEIALMTAANKSTANVVAKENVSCMMLGKSDFHVLLASIEEDMMRANLAKGIVDSTAVNTQQHARLKQLTARRRVTSVDVHNTRCDNRIDTLLPRMAKFMSEALWNSMYSRYFRALVLCKKNKVGEYGNYAIQLVKEMPRCNRVQSVTKIQQLSQRILETDIAKRITGGNVHNLSLSNPQSPLMSPINGGSVAGSESATPITSPPMTSPSSPKSKPSQSRTPKGFVPWVPVNAWDDALFIMGLFEQRNQFSSKLCQKWTQVQKLECAKKFKFSSIKAMNKVFTFGDIGHSLFIILKGAVRIFTQQRLKDSTSSSDNNGLAGGTGANPAYLSAAIQQKSSTLLNPLDNGDQHQEQQQKQHQPHYRRIYQEDLFSGEMFGETVLEGIDHRACMVQAITDCDFAILSAEDYDSVNNISKLVAAQGRGFTELSVDAVYNFMMKVPILKGWEPYRLYRLASATSQMYYPLHKKILSRGQPSNDLYFIMEGTVSIVTSVEDYHDTITNPSHAKNVTSIITTLKPGDYYGETGAMNTLLRLKYPVVECCDAVATSFVHVIVLPHAQFFLLDDKLGTIHNIKTAFVSKRQWRLERYEQLCADKTRSGKAIVKRNRERTREDMGLSEQFGASFIGHSDGADDSFDFDSANDNLTTQELWKTVSNHLGHSMRENMEKDYVPIESLIHERNNKPLPKKHQSKLKSLGSTTIASALSMSQEGSDIEFHLDDGLGGPSIQTAGSMDSGGSPGPSRAIGYSSDTGDAKSCLSPGPGGKSQNQIGRSSSWDHASIANSSSRTAPPKNPTKASILSPKPVSYRSSALHTKLADTARDVTLIHDEQTVLQSLSPTQRDALMAHRFTRASSSSLPPINQSHGASAAPVRFASDEASTSSAASGKRAGIPIKAMYN